MTRLLIGVVALVCGFLAFREVRTSHAPQETFPFARFKAAAVQPVEQLAVCIDAIAAQSDPTKLATLGQRQANPRLKRILYYLAQARATGADPGEVIERAQKQNGSFGTPRAPLVKTSLLRNLKICDGLNLLTPEGLEQLKRGNAPTVGRGPYEGQGIHVDHIVPLSVCYQLGNELANLELLPERLNMGKSAGVGERQIALAKRFRAAGLIDDAALVKIEAAKTDQAWMQKYEMREE